MVHVDTLVDHSDNDVSAPSRDIPCLWRANFRQSVELAEIRIVRHYIAVNDVIRLSILNVVAALERGHCFDRVVRSHASDP